MKQADRVRAQLADWRRRRDLGAEARAGVHARRQIRNLQRQWLRRAWSYLIGLVVATAVFAALALVLLPEPLGAYGTGAVVASGGWLGYFFMLDTSGIANLRAGIAGEVQTVFELRRLRRKGWQLVNHVMLEHVDVDHALIGPSGCFAIETKFRTSWQAVQDDELRKWVSRSKDGARAIHFRSGRLRPVVPIVVAWGPGVQDVFPQPVKTNGIIICSGQDLVNVITANEENIMPSEVDVMYRQLDEYVTNRTSREIADHGPVPRALTDHIFDLAFGVLAGMVAIVAVANVGQIEPIFVTYLASCVVIMSVAWLLLRRSAGQRFRASVIGAGGAATAMLLVGLGILLWNIAAWIW